MVKNLPAMGDAVSTSGPGRSLGEENGTHSSIFAWEIPWTEEPGRLHTVHGAAKELDTNSWLKTTRFNKIRSYNTHCFVILIGPLNNTL